ncbi:MAG TPA: hypothetical protein VMS41_04165, partial [Gaiellaceae bacterium]|nr:hypothetical protein [Gaiellaceae bacterium]
RRSVRRLSVREEDDLDGQREEGTHAFAGLIRGGGPLGGNVVREIAEELQAVAAVLGRVAGDERTGLSTQSTRSFGSILNADGSRSPSLKTVPSTGLGSPSSGGGTYRGAP